MNPLGIYFHIPFCQKKCPYCDFNSYSSTNSQVQELEENYVKALLLELDYQIQYFSIKNRTCQTIFIGGGTPSLFSPKSYDLILNEISKRISLAEDVEITIECNPRSITEDLTKDKFRGYKNAGINRVSVGCQSFKEDKLKFLGRWHGAEDVKVTVDLARRAGIDNLSLDLIYGTKGETIEDWLFDLDSALANNPDHISAYALTIEPMTNFGKRALKKGEVLSVTDDQCAEFFLVTQAKLREANFQQYEVSNYSLGNKECRHNLLYWKGGEYLALGAGAHGFIKFDNKKGLRWSNFRNPSIYVTKACSGQGSMEVFDYVDESSLFTEYLAFGLRLVSGIDLKDSSDCRVQRLKEILERPELDLLRNKKLIEYSKDRLKIPLDKFRLVDGIIEEILLLFP